MLGLGLQDPVKYVNYQEAVYLALLDMKSAGLVDERVVVMVVGAGRGPLVRASLAASERAQVPILCYAVDKNPNAVVTLRYLSSLLFHFVALGNPQRRLLESPVPFFDAVLGAISSARSGADYYSLGAQVDVALSHQWSDILLQSISVL